MHGCIPEQRIGRARYWQRYVELAARPMSRSRYRAAHQKTGPGLEAGLSCVAQGSHGTDQKTYPEEVNPRVCYQTDRQ